MMKLVFVLVLVRVSSAIAMQDSFVVGLRKLEGLYDDGRSNARELDSKRRGGRDRPRGRPIRGGMMMMMGQMMMGMRPRPGMMRSMGGMVPELSCSAGSPFRLELWTDDVPTETIWDVVDVASGTLLLENGPYNRTDNGRFFVEQICVDPAFGCIELTIYDEGSNGICCDHGVGNFTVFWGGEVVATGGQFVASKSVRFGNCPATIAPTPAEPTPPPTIAPPIVCPTGSDSFRLQLWADKYPDESTWDLVDVTSGVNLLQGGPYDTATYAEKLIVAQMCVNSTIDCVKFTFRDLYNDGICCIFGIGNFTVLWNGNNVFTGGVFMGASSTRIGDCPQTAAPTNLLGELVNRTQ